MRGFVMVVWWGFDLIRSERKKVIRYIAHLWFVAQIGLKFSAQIPEAGGCALFHPAWLTNQLASNCKSGVLLMPASNDPKFVDVYETLKGNKQVPHTGYHFFEDQIHGFCSARGDFQDPAIYAGAIKAYTMAATFWKEEDEKSAAGLRGGKL